MNICMKCCVLIVVYYYNHTRHEDTWSGCCSDCYFEFSKWPPLKIQNFYNSVIYVNICMKFCVLIVLYYYNHIRNEDTWYGWCSDRHFEFSKWPPLKIQIFYNFVIPCEYLHIHFCIDGQLYTESYQVCGHITWFCNSLH